MLYHHFLSWTLLPRIPHLFLSPLPFLFASHPPVFVQVYAFDQSLSSLPILWIRLWAIIISLPSCRGFFFFMCHNILSPALVNLLLFLLFLLLFLLQHISHTHTHTHILSLFSLSPPLIPIVITTQTSLARWWFYNAIPINIHFFFLFLWKFAMRLRWDVRMCICIQRPWTRV